MRVLIVGGGAAGLCCAIRLRQLDPALQVTVLERLEQPGKKLLATGNGRPICRRPTAGRCWISLPLSV